MSKIFKYFSVVLALVVLAACQSSKNQINETNFQIAEVAVNMPDREAKSKLLRHSESFAFKMTNTIKHYSGEYNAYRPSATNAYKLKVDVADVHFKNPVASLLVGDANRISGTAYLIEPNSERVIHTMPIIYVDGGSALLNGISGAVLSVLVKKEAAEGTMSKGFASNIMKQAFPKIKLTEASKKRLKDNSVYEPMSKPISRFSSAPESELAATDEPEVIEN